MRDDDVPTQGPIRKAIPANLEPLSVAELRAFRSELEQEISRVDAEIDSKQQHISQADRVFKF